MTSCVCVHRILRERVRGKFEKGKSQDGEMCVFSHTEGFAKLVNYTTTTTLHFASSSVSESNKSTSTLLALFRRSR